MVTAVFVVTLEGKPLEAHASYESAASWAANLARWGHDGVEVVKVPKVEVAAPLAWDEPGKWAKVVWPEREAA